MANRNRSNTPGWILVAVFVGIPLVVLAVCFGPFLLTAIGAVIADSH